MPPRSVTLCKIFVFLFLCTPLQAQNLRDELARAGKDAASIATQPLRWRSREWARFAVGAAAVAAVYAADESIDRRVQANRSHFTDEFADAITPFGGGRAQQIAIALVAGGAIARNEKVYATGRDALLSELIASGVVTPLLKRGFGRSRPNLDEGARQFDPFASGDSFRSFPSGHATNAFAFATAIAGHFDGPVVPSIVYSVATGVAVSRMNDRAHFASDVLAGALIGRAVAKGVLVRGAKWTVRPIRNGVMISIQTD